MRDSIKIITLSTIVCSIFIGATYLHAEWVNPPSNPPDGNVAAPIHTGPEEQEKEGRVTADSFRARTNVQAEENMWAMENMWAEGTIRAVEGLIAGIDGFGVYSNDYCDRWGNNCFKAEDVSQGGSSADRTWSSENRMARQGYRNDTGSDMVLILGTPRDWTGWRPRVSADGNNWRGVGVSGTRHSRVSNTFVVPDGHWFAYSDSNSNITTSFQACEGYWCNPTWGWHELRANNNVHNAD